MNNLAIIALIWARIAPPNFGSAARITLVFALFAWVVRGVTTSGAAAGAVVCFALIRGAGWSGFLALCAVFLLTWIATRVGYSRKLKLGTAESRRGRDALQVFANLAIAAACAVLFALGHNPKFLAALAAALAEASGDTVASEIGQAVGGVPRLVTNWKSVPVGTDGAITVRGTLAAVLAVATVIAICFATGMVDGRTAFICAGAAMAATLLDSLMGATLERDRRLGNNGVNFLSTLFAASIAFALS
jgi:uncharacterized protein (TIGR00297 family)